jgi:hypothetical protein
VKCAVFFSNGGYATWFQSLIVVASVIVAVYSIKETDNGSAISTSKELALKYFTERPILANANLEMRVAQYQQVQEAKKLILGYDQTSDKNFDHLFEVARPLVEKTIRENKKLTDDYQALDSFFSGVLMCVENGLCDQTSVVKLLRWEALGFYNASCPFMEADAQKYGYDEDTPRYLAFFAGPAGYKSEKDYFCRDHLPFRH